MGFCGSFFNNLLIFIQIVPDYHNIIQHPMDLQKIRENLRQKKYQSREEFLSDVNQIVENSTLYNGAKNNLTMAAHNMLQKCVTRFAEMEDKLMRLEKAINPLLDDNDVVALQFILESILNNKLKTMSESWPFLKPVNKKQVQFRLFSFQLKICILFLTTSCYLFILILH